MVSGEGFRNYRINSFLTNSWRGEGRKKKSIGECEWVSHWLNRNWRGERRATSQAWPWEDPQGPNPQSSLLNSGPGWTQSPAGQLLIGNSSTWGLGTGTQIKIKASKQGSEAAGVGSLATGYLLWSPALKELAAMPLGTDLFETVDALYCSQQERHSELCSSAHTRAWQAATWISAASCMNTFTAITRKGKGSRVLCENSSPFCITYIEEWPYGSPESEHRELCQDIGTVHPEISSQIHGM